MAQPPFLLTYYNPFSDVVKKNGLVGSYIDYVKNTSLAKYSADVVGSYIEEASARQLAATASVGRAICGELYDGFSSLQAQLKRLDLHQAQQLGEVSRGIGQISSELQRVFGVLEGVNQRLELVRDEIKTSNVLLENIGELLRIPDSQKQRQHHIEMALKFLKNAGKDQDLYQDALQDLLDAEKLKRDDFFVLHRIGMIYLYATDLINLEKALDYFTRAAKYAAIESDPDAARLSNVLNQRVNKKFADQAHRLPDKESDITTGSFEDSISTLAAESYFQAGTALYALSRFEEASRMAQKAATRKTLEAKYLFFFAKYLTRLGRVDQAIPQLQKAIELVPEMSLATIGDFDLNREQTVLDLLESLNNDANLKLNNGIERLNEWLKVTNDAGGFQWIVNAKEGLQKSSYPTRQALLLKLAEYDAVMPTVVKIVDSFNKSFIGQGTVKTQVALEIKSSKEEARLLDHIILLGSTGIGKAALARVIAEITHNSIIALDAAQIRTQSDLLNIFLLTLGETDASDGKIILLENVEQLKPKVLETLRSVMNDFAYSIVTGQGRVVKYNYRKFTLICTAVSSDQLSSEFLSSFSMTGRFESYTKEECVSITRRLATQLEVDPELAIANMAGSDFATSRDIFDGLSGLKKREEQRQADEIFRLKSETESCKNDDRMRLEAAKEANKLEEKRIEYEKAEKIRRVYQASDCLAKAKAAEKTEMAKWFRKKDFSSVLELYRQAAAAGSTEAASKIAELTKLI